MLRLLLRAWGCGALRKREKVNIISNESSRHVLINLQPEVIKLKLETEAKGTMGTQMR